MSGCAPQNKNQKGKNLAKRKSLGTKAEGGSATNSVVTENAETDEVTDALLTPLNSPEDSIAKIVDAKQPGSLEDSLSNSDDETGNAEIKDIKDTAPERVDMPTAPFVHSAQRSIFLPMFLGGVIAAMAGYIAARANVLDPFLPPSIRASEPSSDIARQLNTLTLQLTDLEATVAVLPRPQPATKVDLSGLNSQISEIRAQLTENTAEISGLSDQFAAASDTSISAAPLPSTEIDAALAELRSMASAQQKAIDRLLSDARLAKEDAAAAASTIQSRAAMARILAALDSGATFTSALGDLEQNATVEIPNTLRRAAADGVTPLAVLQDDITDAARSALAAARSVDENGGGLIGFLQKHLGMRSIEPQEGSDPDAVLSRIEAAVRAGRLGDALAEARTLPKISQEALSIWIEQAQARHNAVLAANALAKRLTAF